MKRTSLLLAVLLILGFAAQSFAAGTPAGTMISNQATGTYNDGGGNPMPGVSSNIIQTRVKEDPGVTITLPADQFVANESSVVYSHVVTNTGNFTDDFAIAMTNTDDTKFTVVLYQDLGTVGVYDDGTDLLISGTYELDADEAMNVLLRVTNVSASQNDQTTSEITATSQYVGAVSTSDVVVTTATLATITGSLVADQPTYNPGETITYTVDFDNDGNESALTTVATLHIPANTTYNAGTTTYDADGSGAGAAVNPGDGIWSSGTGTINVGTVAASGNVIITFQVTVNNDATGTISDAAEINYKNSAGTAYTQVDLSEDVDVTRTYDVTVTSVDPDKVGDSGSTVKYLLVVTNTGNGTDNYNWSKDVGEGWTWVFYLDTQKNDDESDDSVLADTDADGTVDTDDILSGENVQIIAIATIPGGTADGTQDVTTVTFTSDNGTTSDDEALTTDVEAPFLALVKSVLPAGDQPPGTDLVYTVTVTNSGSADAGTVVITDPIPGNTSYKAGSLKIGAAGKTDLADADEASCVAGTATFNLGTVTTSTPVSVSFTVTIN
ncbi:DUF11 domain-containing protein [candidate division KSB1 bacterium]|nr:DUF11 domain-containing protein [candidate division KSB1 bacterium]